ncbi:bifunctional salicylyl-CoA 5-hydroxylase/oxidoreductase [Streptomyces eurythermus]|uniref:bifunctional salicylyl-CoA 5-hydroxylase/oxidoreductase n=1 Tax=Streptomyces eurythermus TaxID=42237 RepID=UPI0033F83B7D
MSALRIACIGAGPGGLYFAALMRQRNPFARITVWERNAADDTFGFGVVFSDETLQGVAQSDRTVHERMANSFVTWDAIDVHYRGQVVTSGGHAFAAMGRHQLLAILQERCRELGVDLRFGTPAPDPTELSDYDVVVVADGARSGTRQRHAEQFGQRAEERHCKYIWFGTDLPLKSFKFFIAETEYGVCQAHAYPYSEDRSTFIIEMPEAVWRRYGSPGADGEPIGPEATADCERLFADALAGYRLFTNHSRWAAFTTITNERWHDGRTVLLGDAAHTAHFSIGSGTKLAMEDAAVLAQRLAGCADPLADVPAALDAYEQQRRPVVESLQRSARASLEWFEHPEQYVGQEPLQFAFNLLTRSRRVTYDNLRLRDPDFVAEVDAWFVGAEIRRGTVPEGTLPRPPMFLPYRLRGLELRNRVVVSSMDTYSAVDGLVGDFHLVHYGSRAQGGAGLVMTEMVCVSAEGRITPGCAGLYEPGHEAAWRRIVGFVRETGVRMGVQLGHSGRKGSTRLMWDGIDEPLPDGNWPLLAPSPLPYLPHGQVPREMTRADMEVVRDQFVAAARAAERAGFDLLELHCGHGYLLSSFITPVANRRTDAYGGSLENRLRFPLEVFDAVRAVWPEERPMTVRISATDWVTGGLGGDDAVRVAEAFARHGADAIDVSTGQTTPDARPAYGRSYQTPFSDRIRNEVGVATLTVGAISSDDDVNSILLAGRADLCALGRPHLYDPYWTLHAAAERGVPEAVEWPIQLRAGSRKPPTGRR